MEGRYTNVEDLRPFEMKNKENKYDMLGFFKHLLILGLPLGYVQEGSVKMAYLRQLIPIIS